MICPYCKNESNNSEVCSVCSRKLKFSSKINSHLLMGQIYENILGSPALATEEYRQVIQEKPDDPEGHTGLAKAYLFQKDYPEALKELQKVLKSNPDFPPARYYLAETLYSLKEYGKALDIIISLLKEEPANGRYYYLKGIIYREMGEPSLACDSFKEALHYSPEFSEINKLDTIIEKLETELDIRSLQERIEANPEDGGALSELGEIHLGMENYPLALECFQEAYRLNQDSKNLFSLAEVFFYMEDIESALKIYEKVLEVDPSNYTVLTRMGELYRDGGDILKAMEKLNEAIRLNPELPLAYCILGIAQYEMGNITEAIELINKSISLDAEFSWALGCLGEIYFHLNDFIRARSYFEKTLDIDPESSLACAGLGELYRLKGDTIKALKYVNKAIELEPDFGWAYGTRGALLMSLGKLEDARYDLELAIELEPDYTWAYYMLGRLVFKMGSLPEAAEFVIEILQGDSDELLFPALDFLENFRGARILEILMEAYYMSDTQARYWIIYLLGRMNNSKGLSLLKNALEDENSEIRREAVNSIVSAGGRRAYIHVVKALSDPDPGVRSSAAIALGELDIIKGVKHLRKTLKDEDFSVRYWSKKSLNKLKKNKRKEN